MVVTCNQVEVVTCNREGRNPVKTRQSSPTNRHIQTKSPPSIHEGKISTDSVYELPVMSHIPSLSGAIPKATRSSNPPPLPILPPPASLTSIRVDSLPQIPPKTGTQASIPFTIINEGFQSKGVQLPIKPDRRTKTSLAKRIRNSFRQKSKSEQDDSHLGHIALKTISKEGGRGEPT